MRASKNYRVKSPGLDMRDNLVLRPVPVIKSGLFVQRRVYRPGNNRPIANGTLSRRPVTTNSLQMLYDVRNARVYVSKHRIIVLSGVRARTRGPADRQTPTDLLKKCRAPDIQLLRDTASTLTTASREDRPEKGGSFMVDGQLAGFRPESSNKSAPSRPDATGPAGPLSDRLQREFPTIVYACVRARVCCWPAVK